MTTDVLYSSSLTSLPLLHKGKVRDIYSVDEQHLLIVTCDRISAFDVIMPSAIPGKGKILNEISSFWFNFFSDLIPSQVSTMAVADVVTDSEYSQIKGRAIVVKKLKALPIEAIVRGYIIGSGWKDYQQCGKVCGISLAKNLQLADKLAEAIYTPSSKAAVGEHDENIDFAATIDIVGKDLAEQIRDISIKIYSQASEYAAQRGIIIADTKFEFGVDENNQLTLIDEVLTPDSSRFWQASSYQPGNSPESFDKQYVRDYLETLVIKKQWDKQAPGPALPDEIIANTSAKYLQALKLLKS
ncbi:MAG: phosphoribosylaminoimidazolesuccinocarboxamide synthase [Pseudomonadota bacterium]